MIHQKYEDVVTDELLKGNLDHDAYDGFLQDYRVLHCLLRKYQPKAIMEVGTNIGSGVNVIAHALPATSEIYSLDLDYDTMRLNSDQYPIGENGEDRVGSAALFKYTQLRGDSLTFNFRAYACDAYYIDSDHGFQHPFIETMEILPVEPLIIIYHDTDLKPVADAIQAALKYSPYAKNYQLYRVDGTRISYLLRLNDARIKAAA